MFSRRSFIAAAGASLIAKPALTSENPLPENWIKRGPVLTASLPWHYNVVYEPDLFELNGMVCMFYGAGWHEAAIGIARNPSGDMLTFIPDPTPLFGQGHRGISGVADRVAHIRNPDGTWDIYYGMRRAKFSPDLTTLLAANQVVLAGDQANHARWLSNTSVIQDGNTRYILVDEAIETPYESGNVTGYRMAMLQGAADGPFTRDSRGIVTSLRVGNGLVVGAPTIAKVGDKFHCWTLATIEPEEMLLSKRIYHHSSIDKFNWTIENGGNPALVMDATETAAPVLADQIGDPAIFEYGGKSYLYYDGVRNTANPAAAIYLAEIEAPLASFCV